MKFLSWTVATLLVLVLVTGDLSSQVSTPAVAEPSLLAFLPQFEEGTRRFISGDAALWLQHASRGDDATLMEAWGAYQKGWKELGPRYEWAVARFRESQATLKTEYVASAVSGDLAYTVAIERSEAHLVGQDAPRAMALRVTNVFRKEDGVWKLLHRHADPLIEKTAPNTVLQNAGGAVPPSVPVSPDGLPQPSMAAVADQSLRAFLPQFEEGARRFINGNAGRWLQHASRRDDVTIMGGWGAYERGWKEVGPRYEWAAARFRESGAILRTGYLASGVSGDLAYTVAIERSDARLADQDASRSMALRVSHLFRKEGGVWKLVHRHADPLIDKTAPATVLQK